MGMTDLFITKDRSGVSAGVRKEFDTSFKPASQDEIMKALELATVDEIPDGYIAGWASTKDVDHSYHVVAPDAFADSIRKKGLTGPKGIKLLAQHRSDRPAGKIHKLEYRDGNLWIEAQLNLNISYVKDLYEAAKMNGGMSFSVGFFLVKDGYEFVDVADVGEVLLIKKAELFEVSIVTFPDNEEAGMTYLKGITDVEKFETLAEFEKALVAGGLAESRNEAARLTQVVKRNSHLFAAPPAKSPEDEAPKELDDIAKSLAALREAFTK